MQTITSEHARKGWGQLIDMILAGETVSIERHGRRVAVVIGAKKWAQFEQWLANDEARRLRLSNQRYAEAQADPTLWVSPEQYQEELANAGLVA